MRKVNKSKSNNTNNKICSCNVAIYIAAIIVGGALIWCYWLPCDMFAAIAMSLGSSIIGGVILAFCIDVSNTKRQNDLSFIHRKLILNELVHNVYGMTRDVATVFYKEICAEQLDADKKYAILFTDILELFQHKGECLSNPQFSTRDGVLDAIKAHHQYLHTNTDGIFNCYFTNTWFYDKIIDNCKKIVENEAVYLAIKVLAPVEINAINSVIHMRSSVEIKKSGKFEEMFENYSLILSNLKLIVFENEVFGVAKGRADDTKVSVDAIHIKVVDKNGISIGFKSEKSKILKKEKENGKELVSKIFKQFE